MADIAEGSRVVVDAGKWRGQVGTLVRYSIVLAGQTRAYPVVRLAGGEEVRVSTVSAAPRVRVYVVVNLRRGSVHGMTCNVNQSAAWVRELIERYNDPLAAVQCADLVDPSEQDIPWEKADG